MVTKNPEIIEMRSIANSPVPALASTAQFRSAEDARAADELAAAFERAREAVRRATYAADAASARTRTLTFVSLIGR